MGYRKKRQEKGGPPGGYCHLDAMLCGRCEGTDSKVNITTKERLASAEISTEKLIKIW